MLGRRNNRSHSRIQVNTDENKEKQQHRLNRCPLHRSIRCLPEVPTPCRSISLDASRYQIRNPYSTGWTDGPKKNTGALDVLYSREHGLMDFNFSSAPVEPTLQNQSTGALDVLCSRELVWVDQWTSSAPVEPMPLRSMHRCNEASLDTVSEPQRLQFGHRETGWTDAPNWHPSVLPVLTVFLQWTSNGYVTLSTLYKGTPWLISVAFDTLNTWGHPWEEEKVLWANKRRSSILFVLQPWRIHPLQVCLS